MSELLHKLILSFMLKVPKLKACLGWTVETFNRYFLVGSDQIIELVDFGSTYGSISGPKIL